jgi:CheY-like chemotaxis protein
VKRSILLADNDPDAREKWARFLENAGYRVHVASTALEAQNQLKSTAIDLAVLDVRLEDDRLDTDLSGLELAVDRSFRHVPKIILTAFRMDYQAQRAVWKNVGGEPPVVIAFVDKAEGPQALLQEIQDAFEIWPRLSMLSSKVSEQIKADHNTIRSQARWNYATSVIISLFGFGVIIAGIVLAWADRLGIGIVASATGLMLEALGYLVFRRLDYANRRMDVYHQELLQTYGVEFLLSVAGRLPAEQEGACIEQMVAAVVQNWYPMRAQDGQDRASLPLGDNSEE